jgi:hypothetical protein
VQPLVMAAPADLVEQHEQAQLQKAAACVAARHERQVPPRVDDQGRNVSLYF